jgi:asparagine synthase (glutamine-hydrolysing)
MTDSVKARIDSGNDPAFFLSGGLDSSLLCCIGKDITGTNINAFTIGFEDPKYDESNRASEIANFLKIKHHKLFFKQKSFLEYFHRVAQSSDMPFADPASAATFYAFDNIKEFANYIIDGTGGDSLIGTMPPRYKRVATQYVSLLPKSVRELSRKYLITKYFKDYDALFDFEDPLDLLIMWKAWRISEIKVLCNEDVDLSNNILYQIYRGYSRSKHFEKYSALYRYASDDRIHQAGRVFGVNVRFPYWDQKVQSFADGLRKEFRYKNGEQKRIIGAALREYIPDKILKIRKTGFIFPIDEFMKNNNGEVIRMYINTDSLKKHELFNSRVVKSTVDRYLAGDDSMKFKVWALVVFQAWYENHF